MVLDRLGFGQGINRKGHDKPYEFDGFTKDGSETKAIFYKIKDSPSNPNNPDARIDMRGKTVGFSKQELERALGDKAELINMFGRQGESVSDLRRRINKILSEWRN